MSQQPNLLLIVSVVVAKSVARKVEATLVDPFFVRIFGFSRFVCNSSFSFAK